ncbi:uncharacterized protein LOC132693307 [Panthera onca]
MVEEKEEQNWTDKQNIQHANTKCQVNNSPGGQKSGHVDVKTQDPAREGEKDPCQTRLIPRIIPSVYLVAGWSPGTQTLRLHGSKATDQLRDWLCLGPSKSIS